MGIDEQEIRQLVAMWMTATRSGNIDTVLDLMTEDAIFLTPGHPPMQGRTAFAAAARPNPPNPGPHFDGTNEIQEIKVMGEWAFMWGHLTVVVTPAGGGRSSVRSGHTLSILRKENGKWRLARDANMLSAGPPSGG